MYCYVPDILPVTRKEFSAGVRPKDDVIERVERDAARAAAKGQTTERVFLCFTCDPYPEVDMKSELTRKVLSILKRHGVPFALCTKSGHYAERDFDLYGPRDTFGVTLTTMSAERAQTIEPGAAPPGDRANSLVAAKTAGLNTFVSLEPVHNIAEALQVARDVAEFSDIIKVGPLKKRDANIRQAEWQRFTWRLMAICRAHKTAWYIKDALSRRCGAMAFAFYNTDDRVVGEADHDSGQRRLW
jgi:DNA repair photolyase